ncbi:hypothetical protein OG21DRAFT_1520638 [Imleria badia]|nr:hypothetical protein OG21DRAFT_1520638 [Imleria badia]
MCLDLFLGETGQETFGGCGKTRAVRRTPQLASFPDVFKLVIHAKKFQLKDWVPTKLGTKHRHSHYPTRGGTLYWMATSERDYRQYVILTLLFLYVLVESIASFILSLNSFFCLTSYGITHSPPTHEGLT